MCELEVAAGWWGAGGMRWQCCQAGRWDAARPLMRLLLGVWSAVCPQEEAFVENMCSLWSVVVCIGVAGSNNPLIHWPRGHQSEKQQGLAAQLGSLWSLKPEWMRGLLLPSKP